MDDSAHRREREGAVGEEQTFLTRLLGATNDHDVAAIVDCFHPDYVNETPAHPSRGFHGRDQVRRNWEQILANVPDLAISSPRHAVDGELVWAELAMNGMRRDGVPHRLSGVVTFVVRDGRAASARFFLEPVTDTVEHIDTVVRQTVGSLRDDRS